MAAQTCPRCGGANPPSAAFCQYCGNALPPAPSAPLPSGPAAAPPPGAAAWAPPGYSASAYGQGPYPPSAPPPRPRRHLLLWILVGFVVVLIVVAAVAVLTAPPAVTYTVVVTGINIDSSDNVCGLNGATAQGFNASTNQSVSLTYAISGANNSAGTGTLACNITSVVADTAGFTVSGANTPLKIPANASPLLSFNVETPATPYTGVLTLSFS